MGSPYKQYKTNESVEQKGIILDYGDFEIVVARAGGANKRYQLMMEKKTRPFRNLSSLSDDRLMAILREVYAETVVLSWKNVCGQDGKDIPFSKENFVKLMIDLPDLFRDIIDQASSMAAFRETILEQDAKN